MPLWAAVNGVSRLAKSGRPAAGISIKLWRAAAAAVFGAVGGLDGKEECRPLSGRADREPRSVRID